MKTHGTIYHQASINPWHKSHNAPIPNPTMHHFVTKMCTYVNPTIQHFVTEMCTYYYMCTFLLQNGALWNIWLHCEICKVSHLLMIIYKKKPSNWWPGKDNSINIFSSSLHLYWDSLPQVNSPSLPTNPCNFLWPPEEACRLRSLE